MAYNVIAQADLEVTSNASDSDSSRSLSPKTSPQHHGFEQLPLHADSLGAGCHLEPARTGDAISVGQFASMIRSISSTSYDLVEEDSDCEETIERKSRTSPRRGLPPIDTTMTTTTNKTGSGRQPASSVASPEEPTLRTPISDHPVPLNHPTPGLESLQGAYLGNVERLERSAERMSASSSDIASEIRKMNLEQRRRGSTSSVATSVVASNVDFHTFSGVSPTMYHPSPRSSIRSATHLPPRLAQVPESAPPGQYNHDHQFHAVQGGHAEIERPSSAATNDTYQQAKVLFSDFDGVHCIPQDTAQGCQRQASLTNPPLARQPKSHRTESMAYYPPPVPATLNLPPLLSDKPTQGREKRLTNRLSSVFLGHRRPAPGPSDRPATSRGIEVAQTSPSATLDQTLDDSVHVTVTTSTDRPCTSAEVYGSSSQNLTEQKKKRNSRSLFRFYKKAPSPDPNAESAATDHLSGPTEAEAADTHENTALQSDIANGQEGDGGLDHNEEDLRDYTGPPNTLMAELELRKDELKHRTRTAAAPHALRSTLLQLDAVAQKQSEHRRRRPATIAWDHAHAHAHNNDDDDIPLGMLFPEKPNIPVDTRPLDLVEKRQLEEDEPLSKRRARLRGEQPDDQSSSLSTCMYLPDPHGLVDSDSGDEEETLAQRMKRLRTKGRNSPAGRSDFTSEVLAEISHIKGHDGKEGEAASHDESLAEIRARLRQDLKPQLNRYSKVPRARRSMGSMSLMRPTTVGRQSSHEPAIQHAPVPPQHAFHGRQNPMHQMPANYGHPQYIGYPMAANSYGYGMGAPVAEPKQRKMIDHWRQSVV